MSRTYRHITKNGDKTAYAKKMYMQWFEKQEYFETDKERSDKFLIEFHREGYKHNAKKIYRQLMNKSKKSKDKQTLITHFKKGTFDNMPNFKWHKNVNYWHF
jgi:hypothetical protein